MVLLAAGVVMVGQSRRVWRIVHNVADARVVNAAAHLCRQPLPANVWEGVYVVAKIVALMHGVESALKAVGGEIHFASAALTSVSD